MLEEEQQEFPDLILPPFWGSSDILIYDSAKLTDSPENAEIIDPRAIYCYFPVITDEASITLLNPHNETEELCTFHFPLEHERIAKFFRPEGDLCAISAVSLGFELPESGADEAFARMIQLVDTEIKRGLTLSKDRGKAVGFTQDMVTNPEAMREMALEMSIEDRLGFRREDFGKRVRFTFHFHNVHSGN